MRILAVLFIFSSFGEGVSALAGKRQRESDSESSDEPLQKFQKTQPTVALEAHEVTLINELDQRETKEQVATAKPDVEGIAHEVSKDSSNALDVLSPSVTVLVDATKTRDIKELEYFALQLLEVVRQRVLVGLTMKFVAAKLQALILKVEEEVIANKLLMVDELKTAQASVETFTAILAKNVPK